MRRLSIQSASIVVFFALLWFMLWRQLSGEWSVNDQYSYGWFVPFFAIVLFWLRFEDANFTAGGREPIANRSREAGAADLVKAERWEDRPQASRPARYQLFDKRYSAEPEDRGPRTEDSGSQGANFTAEGRRSAAIHIMGTLLPN